MSARVLVVGYGIVGKRVADAISSQKDMALVGITDVTLSAFHSATDRGYPVFVPAYDVASPLTDDGLKVSGTLDDALSDTDIVVDACPKGVTMRNTPIYEKSATPFIINGGEKATSVGISFNSMANYSEAKGAKNLRVVSCNTTAICRVAIALRRIAPIDQVFVALVRRAADPSRTERGPINAIVPVLGGMSHHGDDVRSVIPDITIQTSAVKVSTTLAHVHMTRVNFSKRVRREAIILALQRTPRITLISGIKSGASDTAKVLESYRDKLRPRGDMWEVGVWEDSIFVDGNTAMLTYCVHMEAIAVPENVDAIRAMLRLEEKAAISIKATDKALGCYKEEAAYDEF